MKTYMKNKEIEGLIVKFISKSITANELDELTTWLAQPENGAIFKEYIKINYAIDYNLSQFNADKAKIKIFNSIDAPQGEKESKWKLPAYLKYAAAAAILLLISSPFIYKQLTQNGNTFTKQESTILPGKDKAILTLATGTQVSLEKGNSYTSDIADSNGENLIYSPPVKIAPKKVAYNYLTVPRGGQFFVQLSDGTKVWLNSASKLKYPVSFVKGMPRKVELLYGEAYFDVSHSTLHGGANFMVNTKGQDVEVLGTEFNIKAYQEQQSIQTTLIKGKVNITNGIVTQELRPGEKAVVNLNNNNMEVVTADVMYEVAWKNGYFMFTKEPLHKMMEILSRWYNVTIHFEDVDKKNFTFSGLLKRTDKIETLLEHIQKTGEINFQIQEDNIIIK